MSYPLTFIDWASADVNDADSMKNENIKNNVIEVFRITDVFNIITTPFDSSTANETKYYW